jgi:soluble lytic murein transglycosylase
VSSADAVGLMQLLPATARKVAQGTELSGEREALFAPGNNIALGVRLLSQLLRRYDGQALLAIAAYNAGEHRIDNWLRQQARVHKSERIPLEAFVESIPITQTRNYVRRVTSFWARYRFLRSGQPLELPDAVVADK